MSQTLFSVSTAQSPSVKQSTQRLLAVSHMLLPVGLVEQTIPPHVTPASGVPPAFPAEPPVPDEPAAPPVAALPPVPVEPPLPVVPPLPVPVGPAVVAGAESSPPHAT
jgi:hypothetical protein